MGNNLAGKRSTGLGSVPEDGLVRESLEAVLQSERFSGAPRLQQFLRFVVEETLAGNQSQIKAYTIGVAAFGYGVDYDPQTNPYVRIVAQRLRKALDDYYGTDGAGDPVRFTLPLGTYVPTVAAAPEHPVRLDDDLTTEAGLALVTFAAVGDDADEAWLASGLSSELLVHLSHFGHLDSIGPLSPDPTDRAESPLSLGARLGARFVLTGSVQVRDQRVRITPRLIETGTNVTVWTEHFDLERHPERAFDLQDEVAVRVAAAVADATGAIARRLASRPDRKPAEDTTVREAVLRWYHWNLTLSPAAHEGARAALTRAVQIDPDHGLARALLSDLYFTEWLQDASFGRDHLARAEELARSAVDLRPDLEFAYWTLGQAHFGRRRFDAFHEAFDQALKLNPAASQIVATYGMLLTALRDWDRANAAIARACRLNPQHPGWYRYPLFMNHARLGDWEAAFVEADRIRTGDMILGPLLRAAALGHLGKAAEAQQEINALLLLQPRFRVTGRELLGRMMYSADNVRLVLGGLAKAGFETSEQIA